MRILHVEDQDLNRRLVKAILERAADPRLRATILDEAPDLQTARSILAANLPDVILLDVRLPDGNGLDFLRLLAIGYEEICWNGEFAAPPEPWP